MRSGNCPGEKALGSAESGQFVFLLLNLADHVGHLGGNVPRNGVHTVSVAMDEIARLNQQAAELHRAAELDDMRIGVRNRDATGEKGEPQRFHRAQIPHCAVRDTSFALQRLRDRRVNFTYQRSQCWGAVDVLEDHNPRLGQGCQMVPPVHAVEVPAAPRRRRRSANAGSHRVAEHRRELGKPAPHRSGNKALVAGPYIESFNGIRNAAGIQLSKALKGGARNRGHNVVIRLRVRG